MPENMRVESRLRLNVRISLNSQSAPYGGLEVNEDVQLTPRSFSEMAEILEAFHVLCEKYRSAEDRLQR
jgi:hypothetical protein